MFACAFSVTFCHIHVLITIQKSKKKKKAIIMTQDEVCEILFMYIISIINIDNKILCRQKVKKKKKYVY